jgi:hypothetical protein
MHAPFISTIPIYSIISLVEIIFVLIVISYLENINNNSMAMSNNVIPVKIIIVPFRFFIF